MPSDDVTQNIRAPEWKPLALNATLEEALEHVKDPGAEVSAALERLQEIRRRLLAMTNDLQAAGVPLHEIQGACAEQAIELSHEINRRRRALIRVGVVK